MTLISAARAVFYMTSCKSTLFSVHSPGRAVLFRTFGKSTSSQVPKWLPELSTIDICKIIFLIRRLNRIGNQGI